MRKITFYILNIEEEKNSLKYIQEFKNSLISYNKVDGIWEFKSHFELSPKKIDFSYGILEINEKLVDTVKDILFNAYEEARSISSENLGIEKVKGNLLSSIVQVINRYSYLDKNSKIDFFDFITEIFINMLMGHYLTNGNKRIALVFLKGFLWDFGYYLKWTQGAWKNYSSHKITIEEFVKKLENKDENNKENAKKEIKEWIMKNVIIGLNWRR